MQKLSFKKLMDNYSVVIPMLQRDYAYGRVDELEKRESFLCNIKSYFSRNEPHELDFVYGTSDENKILTLLDGQQRVTTLFLLHWYLSLIKDNEERYHFTDFKKMMLSEKGESQFRYETRFSSSDFCNAIISLDYNGIDYSPKYMKAIEKKSIILSEYIKKEKWFLAHWSYDPTIVSMLNMLDSIKKFFDPDECRDYYKKLVENDIIVFNFLNLDDFNLTNELYIKMNSRGRGLTRFENLKSKMLKLYDEAAKRAPEQYEIKFKQLQDEFEKTGHSFKSLREYAAYMIDTKWTDVFWNQWLNKSNRGEIPNVDDMMLSFISVMAIFEHILYKMNGKMSLARNDILTREINFLMNEKDENKGVMIRYEKFIEIFSEDNYKFLFDIIDYFNIFNDNGKLKIYLPASFKLYSEKAVFESIINDHEKGMQYEEKVKFFAFVKYISINRIPNQEHLMSWMHFVCNVCANSYNLANYTDTFCTCIAGINYLYDEDIESSLPVRDLSDISTLDKTQIEEEILKIKLSSDKEWELSIKKAEDNLEYFDGRLSYPLIECADVDVNDINSKERRDKFEEYVQIMSEIFPDKEGCRCENALIRAMLSKGDYLMNFRSSHTLLKNNDRDNSWRRFLKERPNIVRPYAVKENDVRAYFKEILDDLLNKKKNNNRISAEDESLENRLNTIAMSRRDNLPVWRKLLIDFPAILEGTDVFSFGENRFIRWNTGNTEFSHKRDKEDNYEINLLEKNTLTGYHAELFSLCKYYELKGKTFGQLGTVFYQKTFTSIEQPFFYLKKNDRIYVKIMYEDDNSFRLVYCEEDKQDESGIPSSEVESRLTSIAL